MDREQLVHKFIQRRLKGEKNLGREDGETFASYELPARTKSGHIYRKTAAAKTSNCKRGESIRHEHMVKGRGQRVSRILPEVRGDRVTRCGVYEPWGHWSSRMTSSIALIQRRSAFFGIAK